MRLAPLASLALLASLACTSDPPIPITGDAAPAPHGDAAPAGDARTSDDDAATSADAAPSGADGGTATQPDAIAPLDPDAGAARPDASAPGPTGCGGTCLAWNRAARCTTTNGVEAWTEETCPAGQGCSAGACTPTACADECGLGQSDCRVWDMGSSGWGTSDAARRPEDRARHYAQWLRTDTASLFHGGVVSVRYTHANRSTVDSIYLGDTALHTGLYLAAEALRLQATRSARARNSVLDLVSTFDLWFHVSGDPGVLATIAVPAGDRRIRDWTDWDCGQFDRHCDVTYDGRRYDFVGDPSRDMYVGPMIGLPLAYDALTGYDEPARERIRHTLVTLAEELIRLRTMSVVFEVNGARLPPRNVMTRFFIPDNREMVDGAIHVTIDTGDIDNSGAITGGQEFMPNPSQFFRQLNILSRLPDIPRSSSAMMVAAMLRSAIHVSDGVPAYAARRQALLDFYLDNADGWGNVNDWITLASASRSFRECGDRYFGYNIAFIPSYLWAHYETDPALRARIVSDVVGRQWSDVQTHKNAFFGLMTAAVTPTAPATIAQMAREQVTDFPPPPRVERAVDLRNDPQYRSRESGCTDQLAHTDAIDTGDRATYYFTWHSSPWELRAPADARQTYPGHDYLLAYWMARATGVMSADRAATCTRFDR